MIIEPEVLYIFSDFRFVVICGVCVVVVVGGVLCWDR